MHMHTYHLPRPLRDHSEEDEVGNTGNNKLSQPPAYAPSKPKCQGSTESRKSAGVWQLWPHPFGVTPKNRVIKGSALGKHNMQGGSKADGPLINLHIFENTVRQPKDSKGNVSCPRVPTSPMQCPYAISGNNLLTPRIIIYNYNNNNSLE